MGIWLTKHRSLNDNEFHMSMSCLQVCIGGKCNGIVFKKASYLFSDVFVQHDGNKMNTSKHNTKLHDSTDNMAANLNRLEEGLMELKNILISQQEEHIKFIQRKVVSLRQILNMFQMLRDGGHYSRSIASFIKMNQKFGNGLVSIILNTLKNTTNTEISMLSQMLKTLDLTLKNKIDLKHHIEKRSYFGACWKGQTLHVKKLFLTAKTNQSPILESIKQHNITYYFSGNLRTKSLVVNQFKSILKPVSRLERTRRSGFLQTQNRKKIVAKSINNFEWEKLVNYVYRKGANTRINGNTIAIF